VTHPDFSRAADVGNPIDPEYELVRLLARTRLDPGQRTRATMLAEGEIRWPYLFGLAGYHGVQALVYVNLREVTERVPPDELTRLRGWINFRTAHGLFLFQELGRIAQLLEEKNVPLLAIKGPVLAQHVYHSLALRPFVDLDLIIPPSAFPKAAALFQADGFQSRPLSRPRRRLYLYVHRQYTFWKDASAASARMPSAVDLHTALMPPGYTAGADFDALWGRSRPLSVMQRTVQMPGAEDLVRILCLHGFKNRWDRLKYVTDLTETLHAEADLDWDVLLRRARAERWSRVLALGLRTCERLAEATLAPEARSMAADPRVQHLVEGIVARMPHQASMRVEPYVDRVKLNLGAQDSVRGQAKYAGYAAVRRLVDVVLPQPS
jgi:hypothetical protein